jgi:hypothetical protein
MNLARVAEIVQEIGVLLQHHHVDAGAREQKPEHQPARPATDDAAAGGEFARHIPTMRSLVR